MTGRAVVVLIVIILTSSLWAERAKGDVPTLEDLRKLAVTGRLNASTRSMIEEYVKHWVKKMIEAKEAKDVVKARKALTDGYKVHPSSPYWQLNYAERSAVHLPSVLSVSHRVKQLQASIAAAAMPQYTIQPMLEKMARHGNPAVRYWAARGYRSAARRILLYDDHARKMLATLERLGLEETGPIVGAVFWALNPYHDAKKETVARLRVVLDKVWLARCGNVQAGRPDVVEAYRKAVGFLAPAPVDKADKKKILQLLADALEAGSLAFVKPQNQKNPAGSSLVDLLSELEGKLVEITSARAPIQGVLAKEKIGSMQKATMVRLAVNEYWKPLLANLGVVPRRVTTATKPTTRPAGPTTAPAGGGT